MSLIEPIFDFCVNFIEQAGYAGIIILMAMESTALPVPSEVVMPFAGFLVYDGKLNMLAVILTGAIGSLIGSLFSYYVGKIFGRAFILKYGKYVLITGGHLTTTENFFQKHGEKAVFIARFVPVVRHLISFPAGIARMDIKKFSLYTFVGSFIWCGILVYLGYLLNQNWSMIEQYTSILDYVFILAVIIFVIWFYLKFKNNMKFK
ncbi:MAG: alkaline phosphatase [Candidatus Altiarchaeales archaeon HGW-Altiarchaeales-1]|nr:MAG: alkaline phosphatase [Candidatus Altiarchaeales archaeon HGW-Altiarchaeales-1]